MIEGVGGEGFGGCWEGSRSVGDFDPGEGISRQGGEDGEGLFEGLLPFLSQEVRKSDM